MTDGNGKSGAPTKEAIAQAAAARVQAQKQVGPAKPLEGAWIQAPKPTSTRVWCRLCSCEGVKGTVLCKEHLEGYEFAVAIMRRYSVHAAERVLLTIQQRKEQDNG